MKTTILILILVSFLQVTIIPLDLVLIFLTLRAFIKSDKSNFYLAFAFGLLTSHLTFTPLGINSLIYLGLISLTYLIRFLPISKNIFVVIPLIILVLSINQFILSLIMKESLHLWPSIFWWGLISIPTHILVRFWEERFVVRDIKLKV